MDLPPYLLYSPTDYGFEWYPWDYLISEWFLLSCGETVTDLYTPPLSHVRIHKGPSPPRNKCAANFLDVRIAQKRPQLLLQQQGERIPYGFTAYFHVLQLELTLWLWVHHPTARPSSGNQQCISFSYAGFEFLAESTAVTCRARGIRFVFESNLWIFLTEELH